MPEPATYDDLHAPVDTTLMKTLVERHLTNQPAGMTTPAVMRAMKEMQRFNGAGDMAGVRVEDMPMTDPDAFSNTLARTPVDFRKIFEKSHTDPEKIEMNPGVSASFPPSALASTLMHELQHVKQNRASLDSLPAQVLRLKQFGLPYEKRPDEIAGFDAATRYDLSTGNDETLTPNHYHNIVEYLGNIFKKSQ